MSVTYHFREQEASIQVHGHFNFAQHAAFRDASRAVLAVTDVKSIEINLMDTDYLDSSALGMLLVLREQATIAASAAFTSVMPNPLSVRFLR